MTSYEKIIDALASDDYYMVKNDIEKLMNDDTFIDIIVKVDNPFVFDRFMKMCEYKIDTSSIYERRNKYLDKELSKEDVSLPDRWIIEDIITYFFQDNYYNFMTNFFKMVNYARFNNEGLVSDEHLELYSHFLSLKEFSNSEKLVFFKKQKSDLMAMFYDDMDIVKNDSHQRLVTEALKLDHNSEIYRRDLSSLLETDVYYLNGSSFYGFVKSFSINRDDLEDHFDHINLNDNYLGHSFSYIGDKNIGTIDYEQKSVILLYDDIDYHNIMYVHHADLHAKKMQEQDDYLSVKENEILTPRELINRTVNYNEIYIKGKYKPKALICYDEIKRNDYLFAKKYDLAILLINTTKYERMENFDEDYNESSYVI